MDIIFESGQPLPSLRIRYLSIDANIVNRTLVKMLLDNIQRAGPEREDHTEVVNKLALRRDYGTYHFSTATC